MTDLMVVSSVCQDTVYAEFRLRNRDVIVGYQKAMIQHLHGNANFDKWNTALANQVGVEAGPATSRSASNQAALLQKAKALDTRRPSGPMPRRRRPPPTRTAPSSEENAGAI